MSITRKTKETSVTCSVFLEGGDISVKTGIGFFDHMLTAFAFHAGWGLSLECEGDLHVDGHHSVEDVGIVLGMALSEAMGDKKGLERFGHAYVPMDEALGFAAVDISGRAYLAFAADFPQECTGDYESCLTVEFFRAFCGSAKLTLHIKAEGDNAHHIQEALFKAAGRALKKALRHSGNEIASTKGIL